MTYTHRQHGPLHWIIGGLALAFMLVAWTLSSAATLVAFALTVVAIALVIIALSVAHLTVSDGGDHLRVRYGPIPLFGTSIPYASIESAEPARSAFIDGWGIHWVPGRGWTYNLWGTECVRLSVNGRTMRIGTDDSEGLAEFLRGRIALPA